MSSDSNDEKRKTSLETLEKLKMEIDRAILQMGDSSSDSEDEAGAVKKPKDDALRKEIIKRVEQNFQRAKDEFNQNVQTQIKQFNESIDSSMKNLKSLCDPTDKQWTKIVQKKRSQIFSEKVHVRRVSTLTERFKVQDFKTIYHIFIAVMIWLSVNLIIQRHQSHQIIFDIGLFTWTFGETGLVLQFWLCQFLMHLLIVPEVIWIHHSKVSKWIYFPIYIIHQLALIVLPTSWALTNQLPPASSLIVCCEMARMSMKIHAYFREKLLYGTGPNTYRQFVPEFAKKRGGTINDMNQPIIKIEDGTAELKKFLYFSFAPTLIYRDHYALIPRPTRWSVVIGHFLNLFLVVFCSFIIWEIYCIPKFQMTAHDPGNMSTFINSVFQSMLPGCAILLFGFFGFLHSWLNAWAEMLHFADRQFYTDWWNAYNFQDYYRMWNIVVHEWLYYYVYQDLIRFSLGKCSRGIAILAVFIFSAVIHEVIIVATLGFFYPALFIIFAGPGVIFYYYCKFKKSPAASVTFWALMIIGLGLLLVLEARGYYAYHYSDKVNYVTDITRSVQFVTNLLSEYPSFSLF